LQNKEDHISMMKSISMKHCLAVVCCICIVFNLYSQSSSKANKRRLLLRDEGLSQLSYVDVANPKANWYVPIPAGRDMQLVGRGRVLIGTGTGYEEREISTGNKVYELTTFNGTLAAHRLKNGNTMLVGLSWQGKEGIVLVEVNGTGEIQRTIAYPGLTYVRLVRETPTGTFMITSNDMVFEGDATGNIIWRVGLAGPEKIHAWQAMRLANGQTVVSCGFAGSFQIFAADGKPVSVITGPAEVHPHFYAGYQILPNGNFVVTNWQGHGPNFGTSGTQLLEYTPKGELVWSWKQDPAKYSSLQGVLVLDGLDLNALHVENDQGVLAPVK
jgi:hypothetical protein